MNNIMTMTIKEIKEMYAGQYDDFEVYKANEDGEYYPTHFHTDNCRFVEEDPEVYTDDSEVGLWDLMNESDYENSIMANTSDYANFAMWYNNKDAKVLCVMLV